MMMMITPYNVDYPLPFLTVDDDDHHGVEA